MYHFSAAEREDYQKSTHCQNVINHSSITRHFMMQGNTLQSTGYQPVRQYMSANNTVRGASTQSRSIPFHRVITGSLHISFWNILAINNISHKGWHRYITQILYLHINEMHRFITEIILKHACYNSEVNGRGGETGRLVFWGLTAEGCVLERVGNKGGEDCGMECAAEPKLSATANLFRRIPLGVMKSVGKKWSRHENLYFRNPVSSIVRSLPTFSAHNFAL